MARPSPGVALQASKDGFFSPPLAGSSREGNWGRHCPLTLGGSEGHTVPDTGAVPVVGGILGSRTSSHRAEASPKAPCMPCCHWPDSVRSAGHSAGGQRGAWKHFAFLHVRGDVSLLVLLFPQCHPCLAHLPPEDSTSKGFCAGVMGVFLLFSWRVLPGWPLAMGGHRNPSRMKGSAPPSALAECSIPLRRGAPAQLQV